MSEIRRNFQNLYDNCTTAGATGSASFDGNPIIGSTSDDPFTTRTRLVVVSPKNGHKFIATQIVSGDTRKIPDFNNMHTRGLNDKGFAYTWSGAGPNPDIEPISSQAIGIPFYQFGQLLLSEADSVEDGIGLLESYPRAIHGNFLFADSVGEIALIEVSTHSLNIETRITDGWIGRTNHWISERMSKIGQIPQVTDSTEVRFERILTLDPNNLDTAHGYGVLLLKFNQHSKGLNYIRKGTGFIRFTPGDCKII